MPFYKASEGRLTYDQLNLPANANHLYQWLAGISDNDWQLIQKKATDLLGAKTSRKIRRSSLANISKLSPRQISRIVYKEQVKNTEDDEFILVGGMFDALNLILESLEKPLELPLEENTGIHLTSRERIFCELLGEMYEKNVAESVGDFMLVDELLTEFSAFWVDSNGVCVLTICAPVTRLRDIPHICEHELISPDLARTLREFADSYTNLPLTVVTHSYGYELFMNCCEKPRISSLISFNPHSLKKYTHHPCDFKIFENGLDTLTNNHYTCASISRNYQFDIPFALQHFY